MLQHKDIHNLSELSSTFVTNHKKEEFFSKFIAILKLGKIHAVFYNVKQKGIPVLTLIHVLINLPFISEHNNIHCFTKGYWAKFTPFKKDSLYRLKSNPMVNWRNFLYSLVTRTLQTIKEREQESNTGITALIFDDSSIAKSGKKIEGVSKIWDHVIQKSILGFQLLVMGYYDGTMFMPIDFSFHRSKGKNKKLAFGLKVKDYKKQFKKQRDKNSFGFTRKKELDNSKIDMSIKMIKRAVKQRIEATYVLTDSWFTCWDMVKTAIDNNLKYIGMFCKSKTYLSLDLNN